MKGRDLIQIIQEYGEEKKVVILLDRHERLSEPIESVDVLSIAGEDVIAIPSDDLTEHGRKINIFMENYDKKVNDCETLLAKIRMEINRKRRIGVNYSVEVKERATLNAQKQAYIQASADFESLLD